MLPNGPKDAAKAKILTHLNLYKKTITGHAAFIFLPSYTLHSQATLVLVRITLRFWNVFGVPEVAKPAPKASEPFAHMNRIR